MKNELKQQKLIFAENTRPAGWELIEVQLCQKSTAGVRDSKSLARSTILNPGSCKSNLSK